jgi:hypothetical protein
MLMTRRYFHTEYYKIRRLVYTLLERGSWQKSSSLISFQRNPEGTQIIMKFLVSASRYWSAVKFYCSTLPCWKWSPHKQRDLSQRVLTASPSRDKCLWLLLLIVSVLYWNKGNTLMLMRTTVRGGGDIGRRGDGGNDHSAPVEAVNTGREEQLLKFYIKPSPLFDQRVWGSINGETNGINETSLKGSFSSIFLFEETQQSFNFTQSPARNPVYFCLQTIEYYTVIYSAIFDKVLIHLYTKFFFLFTFISLWNNLNGGRILSFKTLKIKTLPIFEKSR